MSNTSLVVEELVAAALWVSEPQAETVMAIAAAPARSAKEEGTREQFTSPGYRRDTVVPTEDLVGVRIVDDAVVQAGRCGVLSCCAAAVFAPYPPERRQIRLRARRIVANMENWGSPAGAGHIG
ncbi:hypothetical protein [Mycolicibacterium sp. P9-22]|uniref:hypothetical protein n=1 Tax=Mycolicibacterium sp. P9-22 TaxID=2024613 RepID=UPI0011EE729C|nr:hypothetical protein [Mycolicibacterium sp. P9-22]